MVTLLLWEQASRFESDVFYQGDRKMKCLICEEEFEIIRRQGGQNRQICYSCLPDGLSKNERSQVKRKLYRERSYKDKLLRGCDRCGYNKCAQALEWHHPNDDKTYEPSNLLRDATDIAYQKYLEEIQKCELLCANCHREVHVFV